MRIVPVIKKSITIHPLVDKVIRKYYSMIIVFGCNANYSKALNALILNLLLQMDDTILKGTYGISKVEIEKALKEILK